MKDMSLLSFLSLTIAVSLTICVIFLYFEEIEQFLSFEKTEQEEFCNSYGLNKSWSDTENCVYYLGIDRQTGEDRYMHFTNKELSDYNPQEFRSKMSIHEKRLFEVSN